MKKMREYSKKVIFFMVALWFIGAVYGITVVTVELIAALGSIGEYTTVTVHLPELLNYIGIPVGSGVVGYLLKAAFENREKIKQNFYREGGA